MNSKAAKQILSMKAQFQGTCKQAINGEKKRITLYKETLNSSKFKNYIKCNEILCENGETIKTDNIELCGVVAIKFSKKLICFFSYAHNMDIGNAINYLHQIKELMHEEAENYEEAVANGYCNELQYKEILDSIMEKGKEVERTFQVLEYMVQAKDVGKVTKKMNKRKKKNKKGK